MSNIFYIESPYLAHYGILGMKWGVRRYQNEDGTLTDAGKRRIKRAMSKRDKMLEYGITSKEYRKRNKKFTKYTRKLSEKEIEGLTDKIKADNALRSLSDSRESIAKGKDSVERLLKAVAIAETAAKAYSTFATGRKTATLTKQLKSGNSASSTDTNNSTNANTNAGKNTTVSSVPKNTSSSPNVTNLKAPKVDKKTRKLIESMKVGSPSYNEYLHKGFEASNKIYGLSHEDMVNDFLKDSYKSTGDKYKP